MGIFARLGSLIKSNINDLISRAENPEKMLNQVLLDMQQQLVEAKKAVAVAIADEKKLQKQYNNELDKAKEWERKAMVAVRAGDDNLARQALVRKQEHENISQQFQQQWLAQKQVALVGSDVWGVEVVPNPDPGLAFPAHQILITKHGILLHENLATERLAAAGVYTFAYIYAPVPIKGATGSPGSPLAVY